VADLYGRVFEEMEAIDRQEAPATGLPTGLDALDRMTGGMQPGEVTVFAGRTSTGKSALALNVAEHLALDCDYPVVFFSLEMTGKQLTSRLISSRSGIHGTKVQTANLDDAGWKAVAAVGSEVAGARLWIDDSSEYTAPRLMSAGIYYRQRWGVKLIIVDHAQCVVKSHPNLKLYDHMTEVSQSAKRMAKSTGAAVLLCSQFSRKAEEREGFPRPRLTDLKGSGSLEEDAAQVVGIHWPWKNLKSPDATVDKACAELIVLKNKFGAKGIVKVRWDKTLTRYSNLPMQTPF